MNLIPEIARVILRYLVGAMVAYGLLSPEVGNQIAADHELAIILGAAISFVVEAAFVVAIKRRRRGGHL